MTVTPMKRPRGFDIFPRRLLVEQGYLAAMVWLGFSLTMLVIPIVVSFFRPIEVSSWVFAQSIVQWYALAICVYVGWHQLELHVAHGRSRSSFLKSAFIFVTGFSALLALFCALTFYPETLLYNLMGWTQNMDGERLYDMPLQSHLVFLNAWLGIALWGAGGLFLGVAWYRSTIIGSLGIPFAFALSMVAGVGMASTDGPLQFLVHQGLVPQEPNLLLALALHLLCIAALFLATWYCGRDVPILKKAA